MNIRSLYRISWALESLLKDVVDGDLNDETEVLEVLIDAKRVCDMLSQELGNYIKRMAKGEA
ncbi:hypothetical protein MetMK1DRAFT_00027800 [Metallosphaera yellowstonensis MK1]|uniref:Uncharacterized protein n=1 Tax=Metallosphaera yellowstonensis MK1 TaxID=671065 RepID=H2C874_9CREN|nr:hypothetical protein MetMK1DRAFT_00027800 [Metallosphaera yellowstonensis MK1]